MGNPGQNERLPDGEFETTLAAIGDQLAHLGTGVIVSEEGEITFHNEIVAPIVNTESDRLAGTTITESVVGHTIANAIEAVESTGEDEHFEGYDDILDCWVEGRAYPEGSRVVTMVEELRGGGGNDGELEAEESTLKRLHEIIVDKSLTTEAKIDELLRVGADRLGTSYAFLARISNGQQEIVRGIGGHPKLTTGATAPLSEAYCRHTIEADEPVAVADAPADGWEDDIAYERFGLDCYLGATITVEDEQFGTVCFVDTDPREDPFTPHECTFAELLTDLIHYLIEQQNYERELEAERAFVESLLNSVPDPLFAYDKDGDILRWNQQVEAITGYSGTKLEERGIGDFVLEEERDRVLDAFESILNGEKVSIEASIETHDGDAIPYEFSGAPLRDETGSVIGSVGVGRDISARIEYQERLAGILDTTRSLMQARDREHVAEIAVNAARELLGFELNVFRLYDSDAETLVPIAGTESVTETLGERPVYDVGDGNPGEVFATGEPRLIDDADDLGPARSAMYYPVGVHGTISVCSTEPNAFDESDQQMLALLATSAAAACMRAKREQEVREAQEHTERVLDRVNGLIENTIEVLVQATTREELEEGVVTQLADAEPFSFAWMGQPDITSERLRPSTWAGRADLPIRGQSFDLGHEGDPVSDAYHDATPQLLTSFEGRYGPWTTFAENEEIEAVLIVPLVYKETTYGILAVCADESGALDERERVVIEALGRAVANAINAVERGRILDAAEVIELEFAIDDDSLLFSRLSRDPDCSIEIASTEYQPDGSVRMYLTAMDVEPEAFLDRVRQDSETIDVTCIVEHERECLLEVTVEESLLAELTEYGAVPQDVTAEAGNSRFTVELPYDAEARELFEFVEDRYPGTDLLGYHEREREMVTRQDFKAALSDRLTDRQETALRTAYLGGFFDWPREVDGNELADAMGISRPTYHQHLRAAQGKVFEELFE